MKREDYLNYPTLPYDIYVKIGDAKFIKLFMRKTVLNHASMEKFFKDNMQYLYAMKSDYAESEEVNFLPVRSTTLVVNKEVPFSVHQKRDDIYEEFFEKNILITEEVKKSLKEKKIRKLFIKEMDETLYQDYLDSILEKVLTQTEGNAEDKASALADHALFKLKKVYKNLDKEGMKEISKVTENISKFLESTGEEGLDGLLKVSMGDNVQKHALNVSALSTKMVETIFLMAKDKEKKKLIQGLVGQIDNKKETFEIISIASLLHDIGKEGLEGKGLENHPEEGAKKITDISESSIHKKVAEIIVQHEEFCDGSGYPNKIKKAQMSIFSQIVSLINFFDGLVSEEGKSMEKALEKVTENEKKFNKYLIEALKEML